MADTSEAKVGLADPIPAGKVTDCSHFEAPIGNGALEKRRKVTRIACVEYGQSIMRLGSAY
jgi:hypothetical protein